MLVYLSEPQKGWIYRGADGERREGEEQGEREREQ